MHQPYFNERDERVCWHIILNNAKYWQWSCGTSGKNMHSCWWSSEVTLGFPGQKRLKLGTWWNFELFTCILIMLFYVWQILNPIAISTNVSILLTRIVTALIFNDSTFWPSTQQLTSCSSGLMVLASTTSVLLERYFVGDVEDFGLKSRFY